MGKLFSKIKNARFYKKYIRDLGVTQSLRDCRDSFRVFKAKLIEKIKGDKSPDFCNSFFENLILNTDYEGISTTMKQLLKAQTFDVIVPIYNGYDYLEKLLIDLRKTEMSCRYILVNDASSDERIMPLIDDYSKEHDDVIIINSEENLGFVASVNKGLEISKGHVALVNTDTELPQGWLERLMFPIVSDDKVASTTPFTNSGTIFSFPNFPTNNQIYQGLSVDVIDSYFRRIFPRGVKAPTGVGFCMGMNRLAIEKIGYLDYQAFDRGFGEENDWCQRAIKAGFKNIQVENLFVYHKHGGSFASQEKQELIKNHLEIIRQRYPSYDSDVQRFVAKDPNADLRNIMEVCISINELESTLFFTHALDGGANAYLDREIKKIKAKGGCGARIIYDFRHENYIFDYENIKYSFKTLEELEIIFKCLKFNNVVINDLPEYPDIPGHLETIAALSKATGAKLIMLMHDYFCLCPGIIMMPKSGCFCNDAVGDECDACLKANFNIKKYKCSDANVWRQSWQTFLSQCDEVRCFSTDTFKRVTAHFNDIKPTLVPHEVNYMHDINKTSKTTTTINIGFLGVLATHKGNEIIKEMLAVIDEQNLNINLIIVGFNLDANLPNSSHLIFTGKYSVGQLPRLVYENDIDMFLIPSIWPETFSYTAEEVMRMNMPLACFDLGAPAERVVGYAKGLLLHLDRDLYNEMMSHRSPASKEYIQGLLQQMVDFLKLDLPVNPPKKIVYISEYKSYSSRYRMLHMAEELLYNGYPAQVYEEKMPNPSSIDWSQVQALVVYRARYQTGIKSMMDAAKSNGIPVIYDIDDAIFDYDHMTHFPDIDESVYGDFKQYSSLLYQAMDFADKITVSTDHMAKAVNVAFPGKLVFVNRNVQSQEMTILSEKALESKLADSNRITLGYFSGSNTHNQDFDLIKSALVGIMSRFDNVDLKIVGCLELSEEFNGFEGRIQRNGMRPWQELAEIIAGVDINLMPLVDNEFNLCKSENKWMEAAFVKTATVASYNEEIACHTLDGENILLAKDVNEFEEHLCSLIENPSLRQNIALNAYDYVKANKTTFSNHSDLIEFLQI